MIERSHAIRTKQLLVQITLLWRRLLLIVVLSCSACVADDSGAKAAFDQEAISNDNVSWTASFVGMVPVVKSEQLAKLIEQGDQSADDLLVKALRDDTRYIAAHVGLTFRYIQNPAFGAGSYNGLAITFTADNKVEVQPGQKERLIKFWEETLREKRLRKT